MFDIPDNHSIRLESPCLLCQKINIISGDQNLNNELLRKPGNDIQCLRADRPG